MNYKTWLRIVFLISIIYLILGSLTGVFTISHATILETDLNATERLLDLNFKVDDVEVKRSFITYEDLGISQSDFILLCQIVFAESNLESHLGQKLVAETVLNRVKSDKFPSTIKDTIFQKSQFDGINLASWGSYNQKNANAVIDALTNPQLKDSLFFHGHKYIDTDRYCQRFGLEVILIEGGHTFMKVRD